MIDFLEGHPTTVLIAVSAIYFVAAALLASQRQLWEDEFFTLYISRSGPRGIWQALMTGADQHPPTFYLVMYGVNRLFDFHHLTFRAPQLLAFWVMCLSIFRFVSRRTTNLMGYAAMLFPTATYLIYYASEARGYAGVFGSAGVALVAWDVATSEGISNRRTLAKLVFGLALAAAVCCHYWGVLVAIPFALGALLRFIRTRRTDFALWAALCAPALPILAFLPVIRGARSYASGFWGGSNLRTLLEIYGMILGGASSAIAAVLAVAYYWARRRTLAGANAATAPGESSTDRPETVAVVVAIVLIPVFGMAMAKLAGGALNYRYVGSCVIGIAVCLFMVLHAVSAGSKGFAATMFLIMLLGMWESTREQLLDAEYAARDVQYAGNMLLDRTEADAPIAISEITLFCKLSFYGPKALRPRIAYIADADRAMKILHHNSTDRGLLALRPWFRGNIEPFPDYVAAHPTFYIFGHVAGWPWLTTELLEEHYQFELRERQGERLLYKVAPPGHESPTTQKTPSR